MGERQFPGEFEHLVLAAVMRLEKPYGAMLIEEIEERTGRRVPVGSLYVTLDRLEKKGFVTSTLEGSDRKRGGRPKRFIEPTPAGVRILGEHRRALLSMWDGLESQWDGG